MQPKPATVEDDEMSQIAEQFKALTHAPQTILSESEPLIKLEHSDRLDAAQGPLKEQVGLPRMKQFTSCCPQNVTLPMEPIRALPSPSYRSFAATVVDAPKTSTDIPVTRGPAARDAWFARLAGDVKENTYSPACGISAPVLGYSVYCNKCRETIPDIHYHCSTCDDGDYDLCKKCVDDGALCLGEEHWLIKRSIVAGKVITSTTETLSPRSARKVDSKATLVPVEVELEDPTRTCNNCIQGKPRHRQLNSCADVVIVFQENEFVTCSTCDDFDLCVPCLVASRHGHHPKHAFVVAVEGTKFEAAVEDAMKPGRNTEHAAICDGCDEYIYGIRHKCLDCPDWDYCSTCIEDAKVTHARHRFVPIYEPFSQGFSQGGCTRATYTIPKTRHHGIYCDGALCNKGLSATYIQGDRYKCAVCDDFDLCAACEASPSNTHNKTHPMIKFKTSVRHVSVTTLGENTAGPMPAMGDRRGHVKSQSTETSQVESSNAATQVQTVADLKPEEQVTFVNKAEPVDIKQEHVSAMEVPLVAHFVRDTVQDGTTLPASTVFEQTWTLRNGGTRSWPAGCTVKFVGGDNMCAVDPAHPASVYELVSAAESTTCYTEVAPGQEFGFTVLMRTPPRAGKVISYWRLTGPTGEKFGHRLWCDVMVAEPVAVKQTAKTVESSTPVEVKAENVEHSQMVFPTLEKESPSSSVHEPQVERQESEDAFSEDDFAEGEFDDETEDGFMTDEEWDVLDASDEEYLAEQAKVVKK